MNGKSVMLLNQDKDPQATLDYVQVLYASKEEGKWNIYLESLPNLKIKRKTNNVFYPEKLRINQLGT